MADQFGNLSPEEYQQQQEINRQQKMAQMLLSQTQQPQGQMVGNRFVPPSFFQNILPLVNAYQGRRLAEQADTKAATLAEAIRNRGTQDLEQMLKLSKGTPEQQVPQAGPPTEEMLKQNQVNLPNRIIEAQAPNPMAAILRGQSSNNPLAKQFAGTLLTKMTKEPEQFNLRENEKRFIQNPDGSVTEIAQGKLKEIEQPPEIKLALSLDRSLPRDPNQWTQADADKANAQIIKHIREKRPLNINSTTVMAGETEYNKTFGKETAMEDSTLIKAARNAPQILANNQRQLDLLNSGNVITGVGANQRLDLARFGQAIGVGGKGDIVANTQQLLAGRAGSVLDSIKASGLGAGNGFSNADRDFLEKAKLGGITYDATALKRQIQIENSVTKAMVGLYNQRIKDMPVAERLKLQPVNVGNVEYLGPVKTK